MPPPSLFYYTSDEAPEGSFATKRERKSEEESVDAFYVTIISKYSTYYFKFCCIKNEFIAHYFNLLYNLYTFYCIM